MDASVLDDRCAGGMSGMVGVSNGQINSVSCYELRDNLSYAFNVWRMDGVYRDTGGPGGPGGPHQNGAALSH